MSDAAPTCRLINDQTRRLRSLRTASLTLILCASLTACTTETQTSTVSTGSQPSITVSDTPASTEIPQGAAINENPVKIEVIEAPDPQPQPPVQEQPAASDDRTPWEWLSDDQSADIPNRDAQLLNLANALVDDHRFAESKLLMDLIDANQLDGDQRIDLKFLKVRHFQTNGRYDRALAELHVLATRYPLNSDQQLRQLRLKAYTLSHLDRPLSLASAFIDLYSLLPSGSERTAVGHRLWSVLTGMPAELLNNQIALTKDPIEKQWLELAVAVTSIAYDPFAYEQALVSWLGNNSDHPARYLIEKGLFSDPIWIDKIAVLLPLSSNIRVAAQTFANGLIAQHAVDSSPYKPELAIIDIGDDPGMITRHYYDAVTAGADFVIGPLGTQYVQELVAYGDMILPTLLLGNTQDTLLPPSVMQFSLAPEHEGTAIAQRAHSVGHTTALVLQQPSNWSKRAIDAFIAEWHRLGGAVVDSVTFPIEETDFSQTIKQALNIDSSAQRYSQIKALVGRSMEFDPRRRQDIEFVVLSADSNHGRLIKPHIDFLGAHDLPVYSTSHIFSGELNKIRDQDLDGIEFSDMSWLIDQNANMLHLKKQLQPDEAIARNFERIFAMGIDAYNLALRSKTFLKSPDARHHGVTAVLAVEQDGKVTRNSKWARFSDGIPTLVQSTEHPEFTSAKARFVNSGTSLTQ